jgi:hypothetical protein
LKRRPGFAPLQDFQAVEVPGFYRRFQKKKKAPKGKKKRLSQATYILFSRSFVIFCLLPAPISVILLLHHKK